MKPVYSITLVCKPVYFDLFRLPFGDVELFGLVLWLNWFANLYDSNFLDTIGRHSTTLYSTLLAEFSDLDVTSFASGKLCF